MTDVFHAVAAGDTDAVSDLLRSDRSCAQARNDDGITVVLWALYVGQPAMAKVLAHAKRELDVFETAALGETDRLGALLDMDIRLAYSRNADGYTPLHLAAFFGRPAAAQRLLTAGVNPIFRTCAAWSSTSRSALSSPSSRGTTRLTCTPGRSLPLWPPAAR